MKYPISEIFIFNSKPLWNLTRASSFLECDRKFDGLAKCVGRPDISIHVIVANATEYFSWFRTLLPSLIHKCCENIVRGNFRPQLVRKTDVKNSRRVKRGRVLLVILIKQTFIISRDRRSGWERKTRDQIWQLLHSPARSVSLSLSLLDPAPNL